VRRNVLTPFNNEIVLLVDDNPVSILLVKSLLKRWHLQVDVAANGLEAIKKVLTNKYDILLMDLNMPVLMGSDATKQIRRMGNRYNKLPIIAFSAMDISVIEQSLADAGMNSYISKPFTPETLHAELKKYLP
jgi:CheY-like chemotaxis protein